MIKKEKTPFHRGEYVVIYNLQMNQCVNFLQQLLRRKLRWDDRRKNTCNHDFSLLKT